MPTVLRLGAYRFYFFSHEPSEPPHVHIDLDEASLKACWSRSRWHETTASARARSTP